jgi:hypothetical protein
MAEHTGPGTPGSTQGAAGTSDNSRETTGIVGRVRDQANAQLTTQKTKATDGLGSVAQAVRQTTQHLREGQHDTVARYAEQAADQIERLSQQLRNKDVGELMNNAQQLARRQPALFVGGAFALGLLSARFLKSSSPSSRQGEYRSSGDDRARGSAGPMGGGTSSNAYGNRVPTSASTASQRSRRVSVTNRGGFDQPPPEGL